MALLVKCSCLLLVLCACLILAVWAECSKDCAHCTYHLGQQAEINPLSCTLECEGKLSSTKTWDMCKELLQAGKSEGTQEGESTSTENEKESLERLLAKRYGGFMKRYGGFMKKMDELYHLEPESENNGREILAKRYGGFMKKDPETGSLTDSSDLLRDLLFGGDNREGDYYMENTGKENNVMKRYGGFMRSLKRSTDQEDMAKDLQKRYGGFMRRVGRPEWKLDNQKRYGGFMRRFTDPLFSEEDSEMNSTEDPDTEKRYGGFMGY
ncbi:proenkephalin-A [Protopterus annectens]|uniref:Proenkephalin n=1 Tax=Protopterus annectens TaxID=7888 RepID=Q9I9M1_PROAN|nr:proenkephalin-A [Protopterus annectens]AAF44657.1 proenkephalin [Protopterus annectens]